MDKKNLEIKKGKTATEAISQYHPTYRAFTALSSE
jgi:hypothetical protein